MRRPTSAPEMYAWHTDALLGKRPPIHEDCPQCGWFKIRLVRGGPYVPARIWIDREICIQTGELSDDERLRCHIDGEPRDPFNHWVWLAKNPISQGEFSALCELRNVIPSMAATHVPLDNRSLIIRP